jgi:hypothetical protein
MGSKKAESNEITTGTDPSYNTTGNSGRNIVELAKKV